MLKEKKNLVISTVGDNSLHKYWSNKNGIYDTALIYYGDEEGYEGESTFFKKQKGFKYHLISDILDEMGDELDKYEFVWLPDDDVFLESRDLLRLFHYMNQYNLEIGQPSILGWYGVDITLHQKGSLLRYTNWVEIMCPCFSVSALRKCQDTFKENNCGWSIETIWNVRLEHPHDKIAIIDDVVAIHTRAVFGGDTYKENDPLKEAMDQANEVYERHNLSKEMKKDLMHGEPTSGEVHCSVVYGQIKKEMENGIEKQYRFWPPCDKLKSQMRSL